ncbi:hypothetical protein [Flavobacterium hercynium]|uniref:Uncharacterized protein n=1 Tax=Flavobacterium hercynium TaxID=387094 RepID=A0A226HGL5_9FLAO|nr:hypothetical protein [Flavobacterium hercynium]OXA92806.1 hypothetical protein B0A66_08500 [Flavobacterium hercynium]
MSKFKNLDETQKFAIAIPVLFLVSGVAKSLVQRFRSSSDFHWIYVVGNVSCIVLSILLFFFSLANSISIIRDLKIKWTEKVLWLLLSSSIFLFVLILILIIALK